MRPRVDDEEYVPVEYWDARAELAPKDLYQAVCAYGRSYKENLVMDIVQRKVFYSMVRGLKLRGKRVFELGTGVGRWIPFIQGLGAEYYGVDISRKMVEVARKRFPRAHVYHVNPGDRLPFPDNMFYLSFSITVLHHNDYDEQDRLIGELIRVTQAGGYIFILEAVTPGNRRAKTWFNTYARPPEDWVDAFVSRGSVRLLRRMMVRYWVVRDLARKAARAVGLGGLPRVVEEALLSLDGLVDYYVLRMGVLPRRKYVAVALLFEKSQGGTV